MVVRPYHHVPSFRFESMPLCQPSLPPDQRTVHTKHTRTIQSLTSQQGGTFYLSLVLPPTYPFKPPTVTFTTKIYHPNISNDTPPNSGVMCLGMLKVDEWKPSTKMAAVLEFARQLLKGPSPLLSSAPHSRSDPVRSPAKPASRLTFPPLF